MSMREHHMFRLPALVTARSSARVFWAPAALRGQTLAALLSPSPWREAQTSPGTSRSLEPRSRG